MRQSHRICMYIFHVLVYICEYKYIYIYIIYLCTYTCIHICIYQCIVLFHVHTYSYYIYTPNNTNIYSDAYYIYTLQTIQTYTPSHSSATTTYTYVYVGRYVCMWRYSIYPSVWCRDTIDSRKLVFRSNCTTSEAVLWPSLA